MIEWLNLHLPHPEGMYASDRLEEVLPSAEARVVDALFRHQPFELEERADSVERLFRFDWKRLLERHKLAAHVRPAVRVPEACASFAQCGLSQRAVRGVAVAFSCSSRAFKAGKMRAFDPLLQAEVDAAVHDVSTTHGRGLATYGDVVSVRRKTSSLLSKKSASSVAVSVSSRVAGCAPGRSETALLEPPGKP